MMIFLGFIARVVSTVEILNDRLFAMADTLLYNSNDVCQIIFCINNVSIPVLMCGVVLMESFIEGYQEKN